MNTTRMRLTFWSIGIALLTGASAVVAVAESPVFESGVVKASAVSRSDWREVVFNPPLAASPIVVMGPLSGNDAAPAMVRIQNVSASGFQFRVDEWNYLDGKHGEEEVAYVALVPGRRVIGGLTWEAFAVPGVGGSAQTVSFSEDFATPPAVMAQVYGEFTGAPAGQKRSLVTRVRNVAKTGFSLRVQAEEAVTGTVGPETVHVIAVSPGAGVIDEFQVFAGVTGGVVRDRWTVLNFPQAFENPIFLAQIVTENSSEPVALRYKGLTSTAVSLRVEEEQSADRETKHSNEAVAYLIMKSADPDLDDDGMVDAWELANGFNPNDPTDAGGDADGDGYTNLEEFQNGTAPRQFSQGANGGVVTVTVEVPDAFEKEGTPARLRLTRTGGTDPLLLGFTVGGDAAGGDYSLVDGNGAALVGAIAFPLNVMQATVTILPVRDNLNEVPENLSISLTAAPNYTVNGSTSAAVRIVDAQNTPANDRLFLAYLGPQAGAVTFASGISTLRLRGDNTVGIVSLSFSGLTTVESAVHIHLVNPQGGGWEAESLPLGQVVDHPWTLRPVGIQTSTQAALDALFGGQYYVNVHTEKYPNGEIRGDYRLQQGSSELQVPPPPPPIELLTGAELDRDIARFLMQSTFGPTPGLMAEVRSLINDPAVGNGDRVAGMRAWLDQQMDGARTLQASLLEYTKAADAHEWYIYTSDPTATYYNATFQPGSSNRRRGWWPLAIRAGDHVRQRIAFALSEIFVVSERDGEVGTRHYGAADYYDMLGRDAFGSYRKLLEDVSVHPIMGRYLSHLKNQKQVVDSTGKVIVSPDENYSREVMQLLSIGLVQMHLDGTIKLGLDGLPIPTYDNNDITELARVFTGWSFSKRYDSATQTVVDNTSFNLGNGAQYYQAQWMHPMKMFPTYHDSGQKVVLGGLVIPAGQTGERDLAMVLDALAAHPNTAPFIARRLIQRLVTSNPSRGYIYRVSTRWTETGGNLGEVIKAILLDYEARSLSLVGNVGFGKQKEPIIRYVAALRALNAASKIPLADLVPFGYPASELAKFPAGTTIYRYFTTDDDLGQSPLRSPTVFNWFLPDHSVGGLAAAGLFGPEMQITTETQVIRAINFHYQISYSSSGQSVGSLPIYLGTDDDVKTDLAPYQAIYDAAIAGGATVPAAVTQVVDAFDSLLCAGNLKARYAAAPSPNPRSTIIDAVASIGTAANRVKTALYLLLATPEYIAQK